MAGNGIEFRSVIDFPPPLTPPPSPLTPPPPLTPSPSFSPLLVEDLADTVLTPSVKDALTDANEAIADSQRVRKEAALMIEDLNTQQTQLRDRVHEQMVQKIAQTATLAVSGTVHTVHLLH